MERVELGVLYPYRDNESAEAWTDRVLSHAKEHGTYRQCSIGWHDECSQWDLGESAVCRCLCHGDGVATYSVEGDSEGGTVRVIRSELGKHRWPPQEGEPETMWAWWVLATSPEDAEARAAAKESRILEERRGLKDTGSCAV
jgi:hypothetical protein